MKLTKQLHLHKAEVILLSLLIITRLWLVVELYPQKERMFNGDSPTYEGLAVTLIEEGDYKYDPKGPFSGLIRPPAYPLFIAANYLLFGQNFLFPILWNIVAVVLLYLALKRLARLINIKLSLLILVFYLLDLSWLLHTSQLVTEPLFTLILVWSVCLLLESMQQQRIRKLVLSALLMGIAALIKPTVLYLPVLIVLYLIVPKKLARYGILYAVTFLFCISPWIIRNKITYDTYSFTSIQNDNLALAHAAYVYAEIHKVPFSVAQDELDLLIQEKMQEVNATDYASINSIKLDVGKQYLMSHPLLYVKAIARGVILNLFDPGRIVFNIAFPKEDINKLGFNETIATEGVWGTVLLLLKKDTTTVIVLCAYLLFLAGVNVLAFTGVFVFFRQNREHFIFVSIITFYLLAIGGPIGNSRFRLYIFPFLMLYVNYGILFLQSKLKKQYTTPFKIAATDKLRLH